MSSSSSEEEIAIVYRRRKIFRPRPDYGFMSLTYEFNERFRITENVFSRILETIEPFLVHPTRRNNALSPRQTFQLALHWMGSGSQYHCIADMHGVSKATVCRAVANVITAINELLLVQTVRWPANVGEVVNSFRGISGMPLVCGAVDGTLIKIKAPTENEPAFVDRKSNHSVNVMLVCGPDMTFYYVYANWPGSVSDARVLKKSPLRIRMELGWRPFPGSVLLGDSIYPLKNWLMPPVILNIEDPAQRRYLRAHRSARTVIERAIGIMKQKFPCLNYLRLRPAAACEVVKCCVVLANLSKEDAPLHVVDFENGQNEADYGIEVNEVRNEEARQKLNYFYQHFRNM